MKIKLFFAMLATLPMYANIDSVVAAQNVKDERILNGSENSSRIAAFVIERPKVGNSIGARWSLPGPEIEFTEGGAAFPRNVQLVFKESPINSDYWSLTEKSSPEDGAIQKGVTIIKITRPLIHPIFQDFTLTLPASVEVIMGGAFRTIMPIDNTNSLEREAGCSSITIPGTVKIVGGLVSSKGIAPGETLTLNFKDKSPKSTELEILLSHLLGTPNCKMSEEAHLPESVSEITKEFGESISYIKDLYLPSTLVKLDPEALVLPCSIGYMTIHAPKNLPENVLVALKQLKDQGYRVVFDL